MAKPRTKPSKVRVDMSKLDNSANNNEDTTPIKKPPKKPYLISAGHGITPKANAKKIESNSKKIEKLMGLMKSQGSVRGAGGKGSNLMAIMKGPGKNVDLPK